MENLLNKDMSYSILNNVDIKPLEDLMIKDGKIIAVPFEELNKFSQEELSVFCHKHAIYQVPTTELIQFLKSEIGDLSVLEIGSGNGCIGRSLEIKMTDNKLQLRPEVKIMYDIQGQPIIKYGEDVEELDAIKAVEKYCPQSIVACWVTHKFKEGMAIGNMYGIEEELLFELGVEKYIHVGNENTHGQKPILITHPVKKYKFPWLLSRSMKREDNIIYIFE